MNFTAPAPKAPARRNLFITLGYFLAAYLVIDMLATALTFILIWLLKLPTAGELGISRVRDPGWLLSRPYVVILNLVCWTVFAALDDRRRHREPAPFAETLRVALLWLASAMLLDLVFFVLTPTPVSLNPREFYLDDEPWIALTYASILAGHLIYHVLRHRRPAGGMVKSGHYPGSRREYEIPMGKRAEQKTKQRQHLLDVSLDLFVRKGYHGTTVRDIAAQANVSGGLLFHYFPTKQIILEELAAVARVGNTAVEQLLSAPLPPLSIFEQIADVTVRFLDEPAASRLFLLVNQINTLESVPEPIRELVSSKEVVKASVPIILKGQDGLGIRPGDPLSLALTFWGAIQGIAEARLWFPDTPAPDPQCLVDLLKEHRPQSQTDR